MENLVVVNETHSLMSEQVELLNERFNGDWSRLDLPKDGLKFNKMEDLINNLPSDVNIIFASPVPALMKIVATKNISWSIFHNDNRDKKELPNGQIIMVVAQTGWQLI